MKMKDPTLKTKTKIARTLFRRLSTLTANVLTFELCLFFFSLNLPQTELVSVDGKGGIENLDCNRDANFLGELYMATNPVPLPRASYFVFISLRLH